jgi:hypothetical protein
LLLGPWAPPSPSPSSQLPAPSSSHAAPSSAPSSQQPAASSPQPAASSQQPAASATASAECSQQPPVATSHQQQQPAASSQQPAASSQQCQSQRKAKGAGCWLRSAAPRPPRLIAGPACVAPVGGAWAGFRWALRPRSARRLASGVCWSREGPWPGALDWVPNWVLSGPKLVFLRARPWEGLGLVVVGPFVRRRVSRSLPSSAVFSGGSRRGSSG